MYCTLLIIFVVKIDLKILYLQESKKAKNFEQWGSLTAKFSGASNLPFLLLQLPQIILNARNLLAGNNSALFAVPWLVIQLSKIDEYLCFRTWIKATGYLFSTNENFSGDVYWITWESIVAFLFHKEEGNWGCGSAGPRSCVHICSNNTVGYGRSYASSTLCCYVRSGFYWSSLEFHELLSSSQSWDLAFMGRVYYYCWAIRTSTGNFSTYQASRYGSVLWGQCY